jgi:SAM-dependent methyltransferase
MDQSAIEPFRRHYEDDGSDWGNSSGAGSDAYYTIPYRAFLERFIRMNGIRSIVDIGCGDWMFSRFINFDHLSYRGYDVVESVVDRNRARFASSNVQFDLMPDDLSQVPSADLLVMKDVLQHLPDREIVRHRTELFDRFPRCLLTNSYRKIDTRRNVDILHGEFRCLDLNAAPYEFGGTYLLELSTPLWEELRTLLYVPAPSPSDRG